jgi:hypothetical protein
MTRLGYRFAPEDAPIWVASDMPLEPHARRFWRSWPFAADPRALGHPDIVVEALPMRLVERFSDPRDDWGGGFRLSHPALEGGFMDCPSAEEAANQLAGVLVAVRVRATPGGIAVHAAACQTAAGLLVLPGASMSGKSTLSLQLMLLGGRLFGDDRLLVDASNAQGTALGLTPRLRLPVPSDAGDALARLAANRGVAEGNIAYLDLAPDQAAQFGESARIAAFVTPERSAGCSAGLQKASASGIVRALLGGAVTGEAASAATVAAIAGLVARTPCWNMRWSNSAEAGALLWRQFGGDGSACRPAGA